MLGGWAGFDVFFYRLIGMGLSSSLAIVAQGVIGGIALVCIALMFYGVCNESPNFIWPHMIFQIFGIALGIVLTIIAVVSMAAGTSIAESVFGRIFGPLNLPKIENALGPIWPFCLAVIFDFGAAIGIWFYIVVRGSYDYILDKKFFEKYAASKIKNGEKHAEDEIVINSTTKEEIISSGSRSEIELNAAELETKA